MQRNRDGLVPAEPKVAEYSRPDHPIQVISPHGRRLNSHNSSGRNQTAAARNAKVVN